MYWQTRTFKQSAALSLIVFGLTCPANGQTPEASRPTAKKPAQQTAHHGVMPQTHRSVLKNSCFDCHDASTKEGGVNLEDLSFEMDTIETAELWQKVLNAVNSGEMPPQDSDQLTAATKTNFLADLSQQLVIARDDLSDCGGVITMRRLNRREYENTIESLLGVKIVAADLPDDATSGGFDTTGSALFFSSNQFEQYLNLAERALDQAIVTGNKPKLQKVRTEVERQFRTRISKIAAKHKKDWDRAEAWKNSNGKPPTDFGFIDADRVEFEARSYTRFYPTYKAYLDHPASKDGAPLFNFFRGCSGPTVTLPANSEARRFIIRSRIAVLNDDIPEHRRYIEFGSVSPGTNGGEINVQGFRKITGTMDEPQIVEIEFAPTHSEDRTFKIRERHINDAAAARRFFTTSLAKTKQGPPPALWIDWVETEGPLIEQWPPESHSRIFLPKTDGQTNYKYVRSVIETFAGRAFRTKKPSKAFIDRLMKLYSSQLKNGVKSKEAIKEPLSIILASPGFLYLNEPTFGNDRHELNDQELAVRLSYFLWSSPPDDELQRLAAAGQLKTPAVLKAQTTRLLRDPRSDEFVAGFAHQWLNMDRLEFFQFNFDKYPRFDDSVKTSARSEVYETIKDAIHNGRPIGELLKSDHVMVNNLLASFYGIEAVEGGHFRRVTVPDNMPRGGLLGMAAIMAMGSDGEKSSPVERGAWVLRCLLNDAPPPAPANVPQLSRLEGRLLSAREMQKVHQEEPQCAQCHRKIDPLGFGLQNFNAIGQWRTAEVVALSKAERKKAKQSKRPGSKTFQIDASGTMPDGTQFDNFFELRDRIVEQENAFARGFTENLIEYALGRPFGFTDYNLADSIMNAAQSRDYAMDVFIHSLIESTHFKMK